MSKLLKEIRDLLERDGVDVDAEYEKYKKTKSYLDRERKVEKILSLLSGLSPSKPILN